MRYILFVLLGICFISSVPAQDNPGDKMFKFGINGGIGASYTDRQILINLQGSFTLDYYFKNAQSVQFAPSEKFSLYGGPAITFDIGYFKDMGISAGILYHFDKISAIDLSAFTFTPYDYNIDYLYVPVSISYRFSF